MALTSRRESGPRPFPNPKGIVASSPRLPSWRGYLGSRFGNGFNRNAVVAKIVRVGNGNGMAATALRLEMICGTFSQGSSFLATAGLWAGIPLGFATGRSRRSGAGPGQGRKNGWARMPPSARLRFRCAEDCKCGNTRLSIKSDARLANQRAPGKLLAMKACQRSNPTRDLSNLQ